MHQIRKITMDSITENQFRQIISLEKMCQPQPYTPEMLQECICELDTFACLSGNEILGFVTVNTDSQYLGGSLYVVNINVHPDHRREGIGRKLLETAFRAFPECHHLSLDVEKENTGAIALYTKLGFQISDEPSRNGDTDWVMVKRQS